MTKKRSRSAKAALRQQQAMVKRNARGKRFVGDDTGSAHGRAAERAKVLRMQVVARDQEAERARAERMERPLWKAVGGLVVGAARLATSLARLPFRLARAPLRIATALVVPRLRAA